MSDPLMSKEDSMTIMKLVEENETTFVQVEKKTPVIDKYALEKLLFNKPQADEQPVRLIRIRCDRGANMWALFDERGKKVLSHFTCGIIKDATLSSKEVPAAGCGGADYIGMASGDMIHDGQPVTVPSEHVHRLVFDRYDGCFRDRYTGEQITRVDYLILKDGCHAEYIAKP